MISACKWIRMNSELKLAAYTYFRVPLKLEGGGVQEPSAAGATSAPCSSWHCAIRSLHTGLKRLVKCHRGSYVFLSEVLPSFFCMPDEKLNISSPHPGFTNCFCVRKTGSGILQTAHSSERWGPSQSASLHFQSH